VLSVLVNNIFDYKYISNGYFYTYDDDYSNPPAVKTIEGAIIIPSGINGRIDQSSSLEDRSDTKPESICFHFVLKLLLVTLFLIKHF
jgi:hypothetical protein